MFKSFIPNGASIMRNIISHGIAHLFWAVLGLFVWFAPERLVAFLIEGLPEFFTPYRARVLLIGTATLIFLITLKPRPQQKHQSPSWLFRWLRIFKAAEVKERSVPKGHTEEAKPIPQSQTIALNNFLRQAERTGWQFTADNSFDIHHFADALRDAGSTEEIQFWGRKVQHIQNHTRHKTLTEITSDAWKGAVIRPLFCLEDSNDGTTMIVSDNFRTTVEREALQGDLYKDIYLNTAQAMDWLSSTQSLFQRRIRWSPSLDCVNRLREWGQIGDSVEITWHDKHSHPVAKCLEDAFSNAGWSVNFISDMYDVGSPHYVVGIKVQGISESLVGGVSLTLEQHGLPQITRNAHSKTFNDRRKIRIRVGIDDGNW